MLGDRNIYGIVWLDEGLVATSRSGKLVEFVPLGEKITDSVIALLGFDDQILALRRRPDASVIIPNVSIDFEREPGPRITLIVFWEPRAKHFLLVVGQALSRMDLEVELSRQVRMRAIAEAEVVEKSVAVQRANQELAIANGDLEEFAYVISHDLKAPLRALRYVASDVERSIATNDGTTAREKLSEMGIQLKRMSSMLTGLLEYSRVGRKLDVIDSVETRALVDEIVASLDVPRGVRIEIAGEWPRLVTLVQPLDLVVRNLVDNAVKHHDRPRGRIHIEARISGSMLEIEIADDGPGIPVDWQSAVFLPFRKSAEDDRHPESSGIGLALVRKTLERVGGRIEVRSDPPRQRGTTFVLFWPRDLDPTIGQLMQP